MERWIQSWRNGGSNWNRIIVRIWISAMMRVRVIVSSKAKVRSEKG